MNRLRDLIQPRPSLGLIAVLAAALIVGFAGGAAADDTPGDERAAERDSDDREARDDDRDHDRRGRDRDGDGRSGRRGPPGFFRDDRYPSSLRPPQVIETPFDDEQIEQVLDAIDQMQPDAADRLRKLREEDAERFESVISRIGPHALHMAQLREDDPEAFELRQQEHKLGIRAMHLAREARHADDEEKQEQHRKELKQVLEEQFDVRTQLLEHEMAQLEAHLENLRDRLAEQRQQREQFIERRYDMILRFSRRHRDRDRDRDRDRRRSRDHDDDDDDDRNHDDRDDDA